MTIANHINYKKYLIKTKLMQMDYTHAPGRCYVCLFNYAGMGDNLVDMCSLSHEHVPTSRNTHAGSDFSTV